jgi:hypothetical protein
MRAEKRVADGEPTKYDPKRPIYGNSGLINAKTSPVFGEDATQNVRVLACPIDKVMPIKRSMGIASTTLGLSGGGNGAAGSVAQHSQDVLSNVLVKPVFWGSQWLHPNTPGAGAILWAIRSIFMGPYMSGLAQYGVGNGVLDPNPIFTGFAGDPPQNFTQTAIEGMLKSLFDSGQLQTTNPQILLCVFTPIDVFSEHRDDNGYHTFMHHHVNVPYAWIRNTGILDFITGVLSHELVEACTDPFMDAVFGDAGSCGQAGTCEIGDYCYGPTAGRGSGQLGGINLSAYWSVRDGSCILPRERSVPGDVQGNVALIQGRFLSPGNFELVTPLASGGLAHYSRVNDDPALPWSGPETFGTEVGPFDVVTMIQSNFTMGGPGNLELVARARDLGQLLFFWREDVPPYFWHGPFVLPLPASVTVFGNPSLIQGRFGKRGNFELVTPLAEGGLAHYWRDNDDANLAWHGPSIFAQDRGVFDAVTMIQSDFASPGGAGNLEVIARSGGQLLHYSREDAPPWQWFGPIVLPLSAPGQNSRLVSGYPSLVESKLGPIVKGYLQLVTPLADGGLAHYTRVDNTTGSDWRGPEIFGTGLGSLDAVSLIQSTFSSSKTGVGNLELVTLFRNMLLHFWREDVTQIADISNFSLVWYGPWVVTSGL